MRITLKAKLGATFLVVIVAFGQELEARFRLEKLGSAA